MKKLIFLVMVLSGCSSHCIPDETCQGHIRKCQKQLTLCKINLGTCREK